MKVPICVALTALLSACIPIGIRGTSVVDAGTQRPAIGLPSGAAAMVAPGSLASGPRHT